MKAPTKLPRYLEVDVEGGDPVDGGGDGSALGHAEGVRSVLEAGGLAANDVDGHCGVGQSRVAALVAGLHDTLRTKRTCRVEKCLHSKQRGDRLQIYSGLVNTVS